MYDVVIIGGGPAGLTAAIYCARFKLKTLVLEREVIGGKVAYAPLIENYPGFPEGVKGFDLAQKMYEQATRSGAEVLFPEEVVEVDFSSKVKKIVTRSGKTYEAKAVIIATGLSKKPQIKGVEEYLGRGVSFCAVCDAPFYKGKTVAVVGSDEKAFEEAIYLQEYTRPEAHITQLIRMAINNLAAVPSIVFGLFGLGFFIGFIGNGIDSIFYSSEGPVWGQPAILWASLTLAVLTLPIVIVSTEEALRTIPCELKEASYALGATKLQTIWRVILPQAMPGILTGAILAVSRGAGEVAPIMFTGAAYYLPYLPGALNDQFMELGYHIYVMATQSPDIEATKPILYGTVLVLLGLTFALNFMAILIRSRLRLRRINA